MQNDWILDVLADLRTFAQKNGLGALAEQLDDTRLLAATELALNGKGLRAHESGASKTIGHTVECVGKRLRTF